MITTHPLFLYALDPLHIGAGGYRLGRVDLTIVRDAATNLPFIPGSSLNGVVRSAALFVLPEEQRAKAIAYAQATLSSGHKKHPHRGKEDPVACIFGYAEGDDEGESRIGAVSFRDATLLAYPVPTMLGPRWITTPALLRQAGCQEVPEPPQIETILAPKTETIKRLNLGWLLLDVATAELSFPELPETITAATTIRERLLVVHDALFPALVNANLENRTSVSIDFATGAAAEGALFTFEAVARGALFLGQVDFDTAGFPDIAAEAKPLIAKALDLACALGIGAMTTRGLGRMAWGFGKGGA